MICPVTSINDVPPVTSCERKQVSLQMAGHWTCPVPALPDPSQGWNPILHAILIKRSTPEKIYPGSLPSLDRILRPDRPFGWTIQGIDVKPLNSTQVTSSQVQVTK